MHDADPDAAPAHAPLPALVVLVAVGGALGSLTRYGLQEVHPGLLTTLVINVLGSFWLGLLVAARPVGRWSRPFLGTGVLGGFTTFSALAVQAGEQAAATAGLYVVATLALGIGAAHVGGRAAR